MLRALWQRVASSPHAVYVELPQPRGSVSSIAGTFDVERVGPTGGAHVGVLRLHLETIDRAFVSRSTASDGGLGFRRFEGLSREQRYAEVLGHELGHALWTLASPQRAAHVLALQNRQLDLLVKLRTAAGNERSRILDEMEAVNAQGERLEAYGLAAERLVFAELSGDAHASAASLLAMLERARRLHPYGASISARYSASARPASAPWPSPRNAVWR